MFNFLILFIATLVAIEAVPVRPNEQRADSVSLLSAKRILQNNPLIDGHNDLSHMLRKNFENRFQRFNLSDFSLFNLPGSNNVTHTDLKKLKEGKLGAQFWAVYANCTTQGRDAARLHLEQLDVMKRLFKRYPDVFQLAKTAKEVRDAFKAGKIASLFGLESGHAIDSSLSMLRIFYNFGVRYMTLTHNCNTPWADNNLVDSNTTAARHNGLTDFGKTLVREMNRLGMMVDLSHVSYKTMLDALEVSKVPVIFSHSSVYSICNHTRNVRDDVLRKLRINGGVIMINFYNGFVTCSPTASVKDVVAHFRYVRNLIGVEHIGVGADFDGVNGTPTDLEDVSKYPELFAALLEDGWTEDELIKVAGGNILRVMEENEKYAASVAAQWPIDDLIDDKYLEEAGHKPCRTTF